MNKADLRLTDAIREYLLQSGEIEEARWHRTSANDRAEGMAKDIAGLALRGVVAWLREQHALAGNQPCYLSEFADLLEAPLNEEAHSG